MLGHCLSKHIRDWQTGELKHFKKTIFDEHVDIFMHLLNQFVCIITHLVWNTAVYHTLSIVEDIC